MTYFWKTFFDNFFIKFTLLVLISKVLLQCAASSVKCFNAFMCFYWRGNHLTKSFVMQSLVCLHFEFRRGKLGINCVRGILCSRSKLKIRIVVRGGSPSCYLIDTPLLKGPIPPLCKRLLMFTLPFAPPPPTWLFNYEPLSN